MSKIVLSYSTTANPMPASTAGSQSAIGKSSSAVTVPTISLNLSGVAAADMATIVILMMVQDGDQDLTEKMLEAQAQMAAKQALRALIALYQQMASMLLQQGFSSEEQLQNQAAFDSFQEFVSHLEAEYGGASEAAPPPTSMVISNAAGLKLSLSTVCSRGSA